MDKDGGGSVCEEEVRSLDSDDQALVHYTNPVQRPSPNPRCQPEPQRPPEPHREISRDVLAAKPMDTRSLDEAGLYKRWPG